MKKEVNIRILLAFALLLSGIVFMSINTAQAFGQTQATATAIITPQLGTPVPRQDLDTMKETYQQVLDVSKRAVEEIHQTANDILTLVGVIFVAITLGGFGGAWLLSTFAKRASDKATDAQQKAVEALDVIKNTAKKATELEKRNGVALKTTDELTKKQNNLLAQLEGAENILHDLQREIAQIKSSGERDREVIKKPLTLVQIDEYGMQALSGSPAEKDRSILSLIEMSTRPDAVVQRRAVKALGVLDDYYESVVERLKEIINSDVAQGVRKEAEKSLKLIEAKKPKKTTKRK